MNGPAPDVPVLVAPFADVDRGRSAMTLPAGRTVAEIVSAAVPGCTSSDLEQLRVTLVSESAAAAVAPAHWRHVRPRPGTQVVIRVIPAGGGNQGLRSLLLAVVSIAALAAAPFAAGLIGVSGQVGVGLVGAGLQLVGAYLVNTLIPVQPPDPPDKPRNRYSIGGWQNEARPGQPVPYVLGQLRYAPPFAATSFTEIVGDIQYVRALFTFGYGPVKIEDPRLGDTSLDDYDEVEIELREGREDDDPITLYPFQVLEQSEGVELVRPPQYDDDGEEIDGPTVETPVVRSTARDTQSVSVIISFPAGLHRINREGETRSNNVEIRIRQRQSEADPWQEVETLRFVAAKTDPFFRQHTWQLPSRGKWDIEITRITNDESSHVSRTILAAVQSIRPEYPLAFGKPLALAALRIKATYQLNGQLDNFNALVKRYAPDWTGSAWVEGLPRNPAAAYRAALTGPANPFPVAPAALDGDQLADWHDFCAAKGLRYDRVHDADETLGDMLRGIAAAGRADWRDDGIRWGVVIDRPADAIVDHISHRNSYDFSTARTYPQLPDAFRVQFLDETNNYEPAERIVPRPDHAGSLDTVEDLAIVGKTDPAEIYREAMRRWYEILHRPDTYSVMQDGALRVATRGDEVAASFRILDETHLAARVQAVSDRVVVLDEEVPAEEGVDYAVRFRTFSGAEDRIGTSRLVPVLPPAAGTRSLVLAEGDHVPAAGSLVHVGPVATDSRRLKVMGVEPGEDRSSRVILADAAHVIDTLTDVVDVPDWDARVGSPIALTGRVPGTPSFRRIESDAGFSPPTAEDAPEAIPTDVTVRLTPSPENSLLLASFRVEYRVQGDPAWIPATVSVAMGGVTIEGVLTGTVLELRAVSIASDGTESAYTATVTHVVGGGAAIPQNLEAEAFTATGGLAHAGLNLAVPVGSDTRGVTFYRVAAGETVDFEEDALGPAVSVAPGTTVTATDGDATRVNLVADGDFRATGAWAPEGGWSLGNARALHTPLATPEALSQPIQLAAGADYAIAFTVSDRTAGDVTPRLAGGAPVSAAAIAETGRAMVTLEAGPGNTRLEFLPSADFDGAIEDVTVYKATASSLAFGQYSYYAVPQNLARVQGAAIGPVSVTINAAGYPDALTGVSVTTGPGRIEASGAVPAGARIAKVRIYHAVTSDPGEAVQIGDDVPVAPGGAFAIFAGDGDASNALQNPSFTGGGAFWSVAAGGWGFADDVARHTPGGATGVLEQTLTLEAGADWRVSYTGANCQAGGTRVRFVGASDVNGEYYTTDGAFAQMMTAPAAMSAFTLRCDSTYGGDVDDIFVVKSTPACAPFGAGFVWVVPVSDTDREGPWDGPRAVFTP